MKLGCQVRVESSRLTAGPRVLICPEGGDRHEGWSGRRGRLLKRHRGLLKGEIHEIRLSHADKGRWGRQRRHARGEGRSVLVDVGTGVRKGFANEVENAAKPDERRLALPRVRRITLSRGIVLKVEVTGRQRPRLGRSIVTGPRWTCAVPWISANGRRLDGRRGKVWRGGGAKRAVGAVTLRS